MSEYVMSTASAKIPAGERCDFMPQPTIFNPQTIKASQYQNWKANKYSFLKVTELGPLVSNSSTTISFIIFWDLSMFYQIFLSAQVRRCAIITYKHGIEEFLHELPRYLES